MIKPNWPVARRALLASAGYSLGAGVVASLAGAACAEPAADGPVWSGEYWAKKGDVPLYLYRKRAAAPKAGEASLPVLFFVHGSSDSGRSGFDLSVPGHGEYSMMNVFARLGFDVWTMDHDGYGRSGSSDGNSDIASSVEDLKAGTEVVARETGRQTMSFCGTSSGAIRAGAFAVARPDRIDRLMLIAFTYKGTGSPTLAKRAEQTDYYRTHARRKRDRAMIHSIFTRDGLASSYDFPAVADALADAELKFGDEVPTGTYLDMVTNLPLVDPKRVAAPVMLVRGDHDGIATVADLIDFYQQLPNGDRQFVILPNTAHSPILSRNRHLLWHVLREFLTMPAPAAT